MRNRLQVKVQKSSELPVDWFRRTKATGKEDCETLEKTVKKVIAAVRKDGDQALVNFTKKFDNTTLSIKDIRVTASEIKSAYKEVTNEQIESLKLIKAKLETNEKLFLQRQSGETSKDGIFIQTVLRPIESVGCYVPGGQAVYPSTLVMGVVPAKVAGVSRIVVCSPPTENGSINPLILVAADICGVDEVYRVGGVQAIAVLAYGSETIKPVRKIVGPGSKYVTLAKVLVSQEVAIDMPAGPSEVLILADKSANPKFVAADMISQAEHGSDSIAGLVTSSAGLAEEVCEWLDRLSMATEREAIIVESLTKNGFIITCVDVDEMVSLANVFAPEHLEVLVEKPMEIASRITTAGLVLLGPYSPVALSDYGSGTNHVLPTGGFGYSSSGLSVLDFMRRICVVESTKGGLNKVKRCIEVLASAEHLPNHYKAVEARFE